MTTVNHAQSERAELCDLFEELGPDHPTLCEGWTNRDMAAHLIVRETRPDAALGIIAAPFARHGESVRLQVARRPWPDLISAVRNGPPTLSPMSIGVIDKLANTMEFYIHHEDVRRGVSGADTPVRDLGEELTRELWDILRRGAKLMLRGAPAGVEFVATDAGTTVAKKGSPSVTVTGPVGELALFAYGRQQAAAVELAGPDDLVDAVRTASFGL